MAITNIQELKNKKYIEISLPGWDVNDKFECKLQRVNLLDLAAKGKIPNPLMPAVVKLFKGENLNVESSDDLKCMNELAELFCEVTMVEPTFKEVQDVIGMTDDQKMIIYQFALSGPEILIPFRKQRENPVAGEYGATVSAETK